METEEQPNLIQRLLNKVDGIFTVERPESIELDSYEGFEDLYGKFIDPSNRGLGFRKTVEQKVDDYDGRPGTIKISHKDKNDYSIKFWPDMGQDWVDEQNLSIYRAGTLANAPAVIAPVAAAGKALKGKYFYMPPKTKKPPIQNVTPGGGLTKTTPQRTQIPKYSSGQVVQTSEGPLIRLDPGTINYKVEDSIKAVAFLSDLRGQVDGSGGFLKRLGNKIVGQKEAQPNIFTNPKTGRALPGMAGFKAAMDNEIEAFALSIIKKGNTGYKSLAEFRSKIVNRLDDANKLRLYQSLAEGNNLQNGYIEHLIQKSDAMNWYWHMKGEDRNGLQNVRIAFDTRLKVLKDIAEGLVHGRKTSKGFKKGLGWQTDTLENRLIVSFEDPDVHSFVFNKQGLGNIVVRRAGSGKLVGKLGQYLSSLYPQDQSIAAQLDSDIRGYILSEGLAIQARTPSGKLVNRRPTVSEWKRGFLENRIKLIIKEAPKLSGMSESERNTFIGDAINEDMVQLRQEFPFLPQEQTNPLGDVSTDLPLSETGYLKRGQDKNQIPPLGDPKFRVKEGPFKDLGPYEQFNPNNPKLK